MSGLIMVITDVMVLILIIGFSIPEVRPFPQLMNDTEYSLSLNVRYLSIDAHHMYDTRILVLWYIFSRLLDAVHIPVVTD